MENEGRLRTIVTIDNDQIKYELERENPNVWKLQIYDETTTNGSDIDKEFQRLRVLKAYNVLDSKEEIEFEEITRTAKELFNVPIAIVSLVDLGRQWFKSINSIDGAEEIKEIPRCVGFCSHVVNLKKPNDCLVVLDATKDARFKDNAVVKEGPQIRFYAGAPLYSPEKQILGSLCIMDFKPRLRGFSNREKNQMLVLASEVVLHMITRQTQSK